MNLHKFFNESDFFFCRKKETNRLVELVLISKKIVKIRICSFELVVWSDEQDNWPNVYFKNKQENSVQKLKNNPLIIIIFEDEIYHANVFYHYSSVHFQFVENWFKKKGVAYQRHELDL